MVRLDIHNREDNIEKSNTIARQFLTDLSGALLPNQADYIFEEIPD